MSEMKDGVIAILDALGVKGIWAREDPKTVVEKWNFIIDDFEDLKKLHNEDVEVRSISKVVSFSDTVIVTHVGDEDELQLLSDMGLHLTLPFCNALLKGIFFRGVISRGKFKQTKRMIIGPAVDEAMDWYERHDWIGISLTPSASFLLDKYENEGGKMKWFTRHDIPTKNGHDRDMWVLAWPKFLKAAYALQQDKQNPKSSLLNSFSRSPIGANSILKYKNTIEFYDKIMKKKRR
jgi:hypothetical protein